MIGFVFAMLDVGLVSDTAASNEATTRVIWTDFLEFINNHTHDMYLMRRQDYGCGSR